MTSIGTNLIAGAMLSGKVPVPMLRLRSSSIFARKALRSRGRNGEREFNVLPPPFSTVRRYVRIVVVLRRAIVKSVVCILRIAGEIGRRPFVRRAEVLSFDAIIEIANRNGRAPPGTPPRNSPQEGVGQSCTDARIGRRPNDELTARKSETATAGREHVLQDRAALERQRERSVAGVTVLISRARRCEQNLLVADIGGGDQWRQRNFAKGRSRWIAIGRLKPPQWLTGDNRRCRARHFRYSRSCCSAGHRCHFSHAVES